MAPRRIWCSWATFLYAIGFIGNLAVPTGLDGPAAGSLATALAVDLVLLTLFALQHSIMARKWFKDRWTRVVPKPVERSTYVLFSSIALIVLFWQWRPLGGTVWAVGSPLAQAFLYAGFAFGWGLVLVSTFLIDHFDLFGLRQVWLFLLGREYTAHRFATPGPYRLVRHPLYVGWLFAFWMTPSMSVSHLVFAVVTTLYILAAIRLEERDLVREHGAAYETYRQRVPMLVPSLAQRRGAAGAAPDASGSAAAGQV
jgi:methanethiol S-methyltransferase